MGRKMSRGKQQVLFNYLPGKTFDFERVATIARATNIRGVLRNDLNATILLRKIEENASSWNEAFRPALSESILNDPERFVLLDPKGVQAELFPKVFWCQNRSCGRVFDYSQNDRLPRKLCSACHAGNLIQLRFVKIHRCGELKPLIPPQCQKCKTANHIALDTRGSERISNFRWICRRCGGSLPYYISAGPCSACRWKDLDGKQDSKVQNMDIEVHRAGRTFYAHSAVMLNIPHRDLDKFLALQREEWSAVAAAKYFNLPEVAGRRLSDFAPILSTQQDSQSPGLSGTDLDDLLGRFKDDPAQLAAALTARRQQRKQEQQASAPRTIANILEQRSGISLTVWKSAGQEMLEAALPVESGRTTDLFQQSNRIQEQQIARGMGLARLILIPDYPVITATYGYSRADYTPNKCRLNPFPPEQDHNGKFPIFVDEVQADAILLGLDPKRLCRWLERNGFQPHLPAGTDPDLSLRAYFVQLFEGLRLGQTLSTERPQARLVFGLLHSLSHLCVRQAALLCGLDSTSLAEYVFPRTLGFAIYCNHRFGATIGALTALYEQSLAEWLNAARNTRRCVYDPVCHDHEGSCHACSHLAETSCRFFNLNLNRAFLFSGPDVELGEIRIGYLDPTL